MFGRGWEPAQATIVAVHIKSTSGDGLTSVREFAADVIPASGVPFRARLDEPRIATDFWAPKIGDTVLVHADVEHQKAKFDKSDPRISYKAWKRGNDAGFEAALADAPVAVSPAPIQERAATAAARLSTLKALKDQGVLTDDEFETRRRAIIGGL